MLSNHPLTTLSRDTGNCQRLSTLHYPSGDVEVTAIKLDSESRLGNSSTKSRKNSSKNSMDESTLRKSQSRTRKRIRQKALTLQADRMLTLTFRENVSSLPEAWDVFKYFTKLMRSFFGDRFVYIAVPEYQRRGAVHFHLALHGYYHISIVRKLWLRAVGKRLGNVDITSPRKHNKNSWNPKRISQYLSKYISKQDSVEFNKRRYSSTSTLTPPEPLIEWLALGVPVISVMNDIVKSLTHRPIVTTWEIDSYFKITYIST